MFQPGGNNQLRLNSRELQLTSSSLKISHTSFEYLKVYDDHKSVRRVASCINSVAKTVIKQPG